MPECIEHTKDEYFPKISVCESLVQNDQKKFRNHYILYEYTHPLFFFLNNTLVLKIFKPFIQCKFDMCNMNIVSSLLPLVVFSLQAPFSSKLSKAVTVTLQVSRTVGREVVNGDWTVESLPLEFTGQIAFKD